MTGLESSSRAAGILLAALGLAAAGCTTTAPIAAPSADGTYAGVDASGAPVRLELIALGGALAGPGERGGGPLAVAAVGGSVLLAGPAGISTGRLVPAGDGFELAAPGLEGTARLLRAGDAVPAAGGPFAGRFRDRRSGLEFELRQWGGQIVGGGTLSGRPVALAAFAGTGSAARGGLLLADGSVVEITLEVPAGGRLVLRGLAGERRLGRVR